MSEVEEPRRSSDAVSTSQTSTTTTSGTTSKLKKYTSGSSWTSPFRSSSEKQKNLRKQFQEENSVSQLSVPKKYTSHPTLEAELKKKKDSQKRAKEPASKSTISSTKSVASEPVATENLESANETNTDVTKTDTNNKADESKAETSDESKTADAEVDETKPETKEESETTDADGIIEKETEPEKAITDKEASPESNGDVESERPLAEVEQVEEVSDKDADVEENKEADVEESEKDAPLVNGDAIDEHEEDAEANYNDDNIRELVRQQPIELVTQPEAKYEPVKLPNQDVLDKLQDNPILLSRYQELNSTAIGSISKTIDDPNKVIDLGSGMRLTQQQLLDIAAARVAPVIALINEEVNKTRNEDEIKRQHELSQKVGTHEKKLEKEFEKYLKKLGKTKEKFIKEIERKLQDLTNQMKNADITAANFDKQTHQEIDTSNEDFKTREVKAVEQHGSDKETLIKNHDELLATKKQELEDSKTNQEKTTQEIEELQEKKTQLDTSNSELSTKIDELTSQVNEKVAHLDDLKAKHSEKQEAISKHLSTKEELDNKITASQKDLSTKEEHHKTLAAEIAVLTATLAAYGGKLGELQNDKGLRKQRLDDAKTHYSTWEQEKDDLAKEVARDHERQRLELQHAAETKRIQDDLERKQQKEEEERKRQEEKEEEERNRQEEKEKNERLVKEQKEWEEHERLVKSQQEREEAERLKEDPDHQRKERIARRESEQQRLLQEKEENEQLYLERKRKKEEESARLQKEIEELKQQKQLNAEDERAEAEHLAQAKLDEIEKLKQEHIERETLYKQRVEFEELQKKRALEQIEDLKKIRDLREEKARLASEVNVDPKVHDIQKLIEEREIEVARLSKQIEYDDEELLKVKKTEANNAAAATKETSQPQIVSNKSVSDSVPDKVPKDEAEFRKHSSSNSGATALPVITETKKDTKPTPSQGKQKSNNQSAGTAAAGTAAVIAATAGIGSGAHSGAGTASNASKATTPTSKSTTSNSNVSKTDPERSGSLTKRFKKFTNKFNSKPQEQTPAKSTKSSSNAAVAGATAGTSGSKSDKQRSKSVASGTDNASEYDTYSVYEEVSDTEYHANKDDPNYFEVSSSELEKHRPRE